MTSEMNRTLGVEEKSINNCVCSRKRLVNGSRTARIWQVVAPLLFVAFGLFGVNENAWGIYLREQYTCTGYSYSIPSQMGYTWITLQGTSFNGSFSKDVSDNSSYNDKKSGTGSAPSSINVTATMYAKPKDGYKFVGWYSSSACTGTALSTSTSNNCKYETTVQAVHGSGNPARNFYAKFEAKNYTITLNKHNGENNATVSVTFDSNKNLTTGVAVPTKTGYTFGGYYTGEDGTGTQRINASGAWVAATGFIESGKWKNAGDVTLHAKWTANKYTVTFNFNDDNDDNKATKEYTSKEVTYDAAYGSLPNPTRRFYTFDGWYTTANGGTRVTSASSVTATSNHTLHAHWTLVPENQTLSWGGSMQYNMAKGTRQAISVLSKDLSNVSTGLSTYTYESDKTAVVDIDGEYLVAVAPGTAEITVRQAGNDYFNTATLKATFTVWSKETPIITENGFSAEVVKDLKVGDDVTVSLTNVSDGLNGDFKAVAAKNGGVMGVARDGNTLTFTALHAGRDTITVTQTENSDIFGATKTYYFNVTRYVPEITLSKNNLVLDGTAKLTINNTDGHSLSFNPQGKVSYNDETGVITALVAGTTTLTIHQPLTNTHEGKDTTFTITVSKKTPTLTVRMGGEDRTSMSTALGSTVNVSFEKVSDANVEVSLESGDQFASYKDGVMTTAAVGSAEYWATLRETDTYQGKSVKFTLTVTANTNHLPITGRSYTIGSGSAIDWTHHYETLSFSGIPEKLTFNFAYDYTPFNIFGYNLGDPSLFCPDITLLKKYVDDDKEGTGNEHMIYVEESADNVHWTTKWTNDDATDKNSHPSGDIELDPTTRYVRFHHSSNFKNYYTDIAITEKKYVNDPASTTLDFGTKDINSGIDSMETLIDWCNVAPMTVSCDNPRFTVTPSGFGNYMEYNNTEKIKVFFTHTNATGTEEGDITIQNGTITKTIHVKAKTQKYQQTITWDSELAATGFAMSLNEQIPTDTTVKVIATATNGGRITFTSDKPEYVKVVADTALLAVGIGEAQVTALQVGDAQYDTVRSTKKFVVTLKQKQKIIWDQNLYGLLTTDDTIKLTASATSGGPIVYTLDNDTVLQQKNDSVFRVIGEGKVRITARQAGFTDAEGIEWLEVEQDNFAVVRNPNSDCGGTALSVASLVLDGSKTKETYDLNGIPGETITFKAKHGVKKPAWGVTPSYSPLKVEQYATINNELNWSQIFEQVVGTSENEEYSNVTIKIDQTATKIRFSTLETGTEHTIKDINLASKKFMESDIDSINQNVESNAIWSQEITVSHSDIDLMSISTKQGLLNLSATILGEGCSDYGDDKLTVSYTPAQKNTTYRDTIVITDNKAKPSTIEIPVRLYSTGLNQSIGDFVLPDTVLATNTNVSVSTTASSELDVIFVSSDSTIAYVAEGKLVILKDGIVTITAKQEGNEKYEAATPKDETVVIVKAATSITTPPTAAAITYGQALNASELTGGVGSVEGSFGWQTPATQPTAGPHSYTVVFTPKQDNLYATASTLVSVTVNQATPAISSWPTAGSITIAQSLSDSELEGGEANVEGTFAWKNPAENRLKPGTYERTMVFTPNDNSNYKKVEETVSITVTNVLARITTDPTAYIENNVYGFTLADVTIQGGAANVAGSFGWKDSTTIPQAGTHNYPIVYTPEDLELYSVVEVEVSLTVTKATPNVTTWPTATGLVYGEVLSLSELQDGEVSVGGSFAWVADGSTIYNAGDHTPAVRFTPTDTDNYNTVDGEATLAVTKKALTVTAENKNVTYGDAKPDFSVNYEGFVNSETSAALGGSLAFDCDYAAGSAVGTYDIMPKGLTSSNYAITFSKGTLTVGKKTLTVTADDKNISYGAAAPDYTASYDGFAGEETASVLGGTLAFACTYKAGDDATDYTITPSGLTSGNYAFNYVAGTLHVGKAAATVTAPTAKELTYNGSAQALINAGSTEHGDILYKLGSGDWSADVPTATNAGNYTVSYKVVADANHNDVAETAVSNVAIAKATPEVTAPTAINPEYTGLAQNLVNAGSTTGGTLQYSLLPSAAYSPSIPQAAFIGTYIVYYRVVGNDNYNNVDPAYISATIARPAISIVNSSSWDDVSDSTSVRIPGSTNIVIDEAVSLYSLTIEAGSKLTIAPTGSLRLGKGGITGAAKDSLVLQAVTDATKASSETLGQTSALVFSPDYEGEMPVAKVEMYSVGYKDLSGATDRDEWQYVGIPIAKADYAAKDAFPKSWVYSWNEATDSWVNNRSTLKLQPFVGVATTQYRDANGYKMTFEGQLADNRGIKEIPLTHDGEGWNLIANSFAGPIDVTKLTVEDFGGATATIHIWDTKEDQYIELPVGSIKGLDDRQHVIPSMQAFFVQTTAATTLTLDYNRLVWGGEESNVPLKAKRNGQSESSLNGRMSISLTDGVSTDNLCLLESQNYAAAYENGYDAPKKFSEANVNAIYAIEDERALSVDATNSIAGTRLGLRTTGSGSYLMMFTRVEGSDDWYLLDKQTGAQMLIQEGADYEFEVESGAPVDDRFEIVGPAAAPGVATDVENSDVAEKAVKYLDNNILIIQRKGTKYNSLGQKIQ